jgi:hypothetical protein
MKTSLFLAVVAMGAITLSGCATHETTATTTTANPAGQTYSSSDLKKTGQPNTAGAIGAADSSVQIR